MIKQTKSIDKCICPYCNRIFYVHPAKDKVLVCDACKNTIKINVSVEFTCTIIENVEEQKPIIKQRKEIDYSREAYLAGHRDAYANFRRRIY